MPKSTRWLAMASMVMPSRSPWCSLRWPKDWILPKPHASSAPVRPPSRAFLTRAGKHAELFHEHSFRNLHIPHLQLDEIRTRLRSSTQVLWLWLAIDPCTRLLPVLHLGPAHNMRRICSSTPCNGFWPMIVCRCSPVMASICTSLPSRLILESGSRWVREGGTCAGGRWQLG